MRRPQYAAAIIVFSRARGLFSIKFKNWLEFSCCPTPPRSAGESRYPRLDWIPTFVGMMMSQIAKFQIKTSARRCPALCCDCGVGGGGDRRELCFEAGRRPGGSGGFFVSLARLQDREIGVERTDNLQPDR
jgi:hypothetical protein